MLHKTSVYVNVFPMEKQTKTAVKDSIDDLKIYEIGYLISPGIPEEKLGDEANAIRTLVEDNGGVFISDEFPKMRPLAYTIEKKIGTELKKYSQAYFGWIKFEMEKGSLPVIKKALDGNQNIVRSLLINTVRENTMSVIKPSFKKEDAEVSTSKTPKEEVKESNGTVTVEEIDKSIDELVIE